MMVSYLHHHLPYYISYFFLCCCFGRWLHVGSLVICLLKDLFTDEVLETSTAHELGKYLQLVLHWENYLTNSLRKKTLMYS